MTILEIVDDYRKFRCEQIKDSGYSWYYITVEIKNIGTKEYFASGIMVDQEIKNPWYMYNYRYLNKTRLKKFIPICIGETQTREIINSVISSSNKIELEVKFKKTVYKFCIVYSGINPDLLIKRVTNYVDPII